MDGDNPYIGPRPFQRSEADRFFGREREGRALVSLVVSERLVLFYAQSGAGKSSLINTRLAPGLEERGFVVLPVGRLSGQAAQGVECQNIYTYNLLLSLEKGEQLRPDLARLDLARYLAALPVEDAPAVEPAAGGEAPAAGTVELVEKGYQPLVVIIDQFEELFTTYPEAWSQRAPFLEQVCEAMQADPNLWVVFSMREDYIAALDPYARLFANRLRARYYMERMGFKSALEAVARPVEQARPFVPEAAAELVNNLRLISARAGEDEKAVFVPGEYVEPVQLQVVCFQLWEQLKKRPGKQIGLEDLNDLARGGDLVQFVSRALGDFYEQAVAQVLRYPGARVTERELRGWFSHELITEAGTRGFVFQGDEMTGSLPNPAVRVLEGQFIIRSETRAAGKWVELVHDRFVDPILQANRAWLAAHANPIALDAAAWLREQRAPELLYDGRQLGAALAQMSASPDEFGEKERAFLEASREASERRRLGRQQRTVFIVSGLLVLFGLLAAFAWFNALTATRSAAQARAASTQAAYALQTAQASSVQALVQQSYAVDARNQAVVQSTLASEAQERAEYEGKVARSGQAAALSAYYLETQLDVARILSAEAYQANPGWEARKALLDSLQRGAAVRVARQFGPLSNGMDHWGVAFSPDGSLVAAAEAGGVVSLWDARTGELAAVQPPQRFRQAQLVYAVAFDPSGNFLATGGYDGFLALWDRGSGEVREIRVTFNDWITNLAFQPGGALVAVARRDGLVSLYDYRQQVPRGVLSVANSGAWGLAWSPDGSRLAVGYSDGSIRIWDIVSQLNPPVLRGHENNVRGLAFSADGRYLFSGGRDGRLILWDVNSGQPVRQSLPEETGDILGLAASLDGRLLITGNADLVNPITVWNVDTLRPAGSLTGHTNWVVAAAFSPSGDRFATGGLDESVFIWQVETQQPLSQVTADTQGSPIASLALDGSGRWIAGLAGDEPRILSETGGTLPAPLPAGSLKHALINGREMSVVVGLEDGRLEARSLLNGDLLPARLEPLPGQVLALAGSPDGRMLAAAFCREVTPEQECSQSGIRLVDLASGAALIEDLPQPGSLSALAFHPGGTLLAAGALDGTVSLYGLDGSPKDAAPVLKGASSPVTSLAFSADGSLLAAGQASGDIGLWDAAGWRLIGTLVNSDRSPITGLAFRPQSGGLLSASASGFLRDWDVDFQSWAARACRLAGRSLTREEWEQFFPGSPYHETCPEEVR